ncbi:hypothetical protein ACPA9J_28005 [Pseudomonas aeruginosa]
MARAGTQRRRELIARPLRSRGWKDWGPNRSTTASGGASRQALRWPVASLQLTGLRSPTGWKWVLVRAPPGPGRGDRRPGPAPLPPAARRVGAGADPAEQHVPRASSARSSSTGAVLALADYRSTGWAPAMAPAAPEAMTPRC